MTCTYHTTTPAHSKLHSRTRANAKLTTIIINGDLLDFAAVSRYDKTTDVATLRDEIDVGKDVLALIRRRLPNARITYRLGNHEERLEYYSDAPRS
ncbi:MAG: hypothetical protein KatS3mg038_3640 [Candidatus Kapaibacterium sp.]|nr:MAG: hypothetical protein KatS3mg038_3640 [Candidatus Kapabacteria bacterium]